MSGDIELDDPEVSDGASENDYTDHEHDADVVGKDEDDIADMAEQKFKSDIDENGKVVGSTTGTKPKLDPKDPLRPRRKKARRACFACQRAHLTCGDERPCQRCIKRGLADACQDGVRKKAKYLHDAPPEALRPVLGPNYNQVNNGRPATSNNNMTSNNSTSDPSSSLGSFFPQADTTTAFPPFTNQQTTMPPPLQARLSYTSNQSPTATAFPTQRSRQSSLQTMPMAQVTHEDPNSFSTPLFDPSNPALFNFDLDSLNFGNHYGALEFGMLGHMSSGAAETPPQDNTGTLFSQGMGDVNFNNGVSTSNIGQYGNLYSQDVMTDFGGLDRQNSQNSTQMFGNNQGLPHAYAIGTSSLSHHSPNTDSNASPSASTMGFESSPNTTTYNTPHPQSTPQHRPPKRQETKSIGPKWGTGSVLGKRTRDPSAIYDSVTEPYPYTTGFHSLTAFLQRRFSANKTLRIAKSMASIRPSFISSTNSLTRQDLIFMEKCFQRTLFEYEDFMLNCCTPTIVCRRTGEIAAVNKEFTLLTGWTKDVLLGKEANLNVNTGKSGSGTNSGAASLGNSGRVTPRTRALGTLEQKDSGPQPVFLAEVLDDDSVIEFYEDFARLAYGDSRGSVTTKCKLLKYQPKDGTETNKEGTKAGNRKRKEVGGGIGGLGNRVREIDGENGIVRLERDGKLDCTYCWTAKRDVFDIPMLLVMNFLPCI